MSEEEFCLSCLRPYENWRDKSERKLEAAGNKARFGEGSAFAQEDRSMKYREWHAKLGKGFYANDVDQIEWRGTGVNGFPVAVIELSRIDEELQNPHAYRKAVLERFTIRDAQAFYAVRVATALGVCAFIVLFKFDLSEFHVYNLTKKKGWFVYDQPGYADFLRLIDSRERAVSPPMFSA